MKKNLVICLAFTAFVALMAFNMHVFKVGGGTVVSLAYLNNIAFAQGETVYEFCANEVAHHIQVANWKICANGDYKVWNDCSWLDDSCCPFPTDEPPCGPL